MARKGRLTDDGVVMVRPNSRLDRHNCDRCGGSLIRERVDRYSDPLLGPVNVVLFNAVVREICTSCGEEFVILPNVPGLDAAIALLRVTHCAKLEASEIRYLRRVLGRTGAEMARALGITSETLSRWENGQRPISPMGEKLLRFVVLDDSRLRELAPVVANIANADEWAWTGILPTVHSCGEIPRAELHLTVVKNIGRDRETEEAWALSAA